MSLCIPRIPLLSVKSPLRALAVSSITLNPKQKSFSPKSPKEQLVKRTFDSFKECGVHKSLVESLDTRLKINIPMGIQTIAFKSIRDHQNVMLGDATGTGKTLAFLLPIIQSIMDDYKAVTSRSLFVAVKPNAPAALILVPSKELAEQIYTVARDLCRPDDINCTVGIVAGRSRRTPQKRALNEGVDLLVCTPGRLMDFVESKHVVFSRLRFMVVDEADAILTDTDGDTSFREVFDTCVKSIKSRDGRGKKSCQFVFSSATFPKSVKNYLTTEFAVNEIISSQFHRPAPLVNIEHLITRGEDKMQILLDVLIAFGDEVDDTREKQVLVFCNTVSSCRAVSLFLKDHNVGNLCINGYTSAEERGTNLDVFTRGATGKGSKVLITTDIACRGLDFEHVEHVILFDFPRNPIDFIHRIGRTARAGRRGRVTALLDKKELPLAEAIQKAHNAGEPIDSVPRRQANVKKGDKKDETPLNSLRKLKSKTKIAGRPLNYRSLERSAKRRLLLSRGRRVERKSFDRDDGEKSKKNGKSFVKKSRTLKGKSDPVKARSDVFERSFHSFKRNSSVDRKSRGPSRDRKFKGSKFGGSKLGGRPSRTRQSSGRSAKSEAPSGSSFRPRGSRNFTGKSKR